jgi:hypothetical protein
MNRNWLRAIVMVLGTVTALLTIAWGWPGHAAMPPSSWPSVSDNAIATAPAPPRLVTEILNGEPVSVLYMTRTDDQVLVRCYPGYVPVVSHRAMGANPEADTVPQEGVLSCAVPADLPQTQPAPPASPDSEALPPVE